MTEFMNISRYIELLSAMKCIRDTTHKDHIKRHYYYSHGEINPYRIIPIG